MPRKAPKRKAESVEPNAAAAAAAATAGTAAAGAGVTGDTQRRSVRKRPASPALPQERKSQDRRGAGQKAKAEAEAEAKAKAEAEAEAEANVLGELGLSNGLSPELLYQSLHAVEASATDDTSAAPAHATEASAAAPAEVPAAAPAHATEASAAAPAVAPAATARAAASAASDKPSGSAAKPAAASLPPQPPPLPSAATSSKAPSSSSKAPAAPTAEKAGTSSQPADGALAAAPAPASTDAAKKRKPPMHLRGWYLRKLGKSLRTGELLIAVEGMRCDEHAGSAANKPWHSTAIVTRVSARQLQTSSGSTYVLEGPMHATPPNSASVNEAINTAFAEGFPDDWREHLSRDGRRRGSPNDGKDSDESRQHAPPPPPPASAAASSARPPHLPPPPLARLPPLPPLLLEAEVATVIEHVLSHRHAHPLRCLGLAASTSPRGDADAIRKQYKMLALRLHPDKCEHERAREAFEAVKLAFQKLAPPANPSADPPSDPPANSPADLPSNPPADPPANPPANSPADLPSNPPADPHCGEGDPLADPHHGGEGGNDSEGGGEGGEGGEGGGDGWIWATDATDEEDEDMLLRYRYGDRVAVRFEGHTFIGARVHDTVHDRLVFGRVMAEVGRAKNGFKYNVLFDTHVTPDLHSRSSVLYGNIYTNILSNEMMLVSKELEEEAQAQAQARSSEGKGKQSIGGADGGEQSSGGADDGEQSSGGADGGEQSSGGSGGSGGGGGGVVELTRPSACRGRAAKALKLVKHSPGAPMPRDRFEGLFGIGALAKYDINSEEFVCIEDVTQMAFYFLGEQQRRRLTPDDFRDMYSRVKRTPLPKVVAWCADRGVLLQRITARLDKACDAEGSRLGRELALVRSTGTLAVLVFLLPKGMKNIPENEEHRAYHAMLLTDGMLLNNWTSSRPVVLEDKHRESLARAREALKLPDTYLRTRDVYVYDVWEYSLA